MTNLTTTKHQPLLLNPDLNWWWITPEEAQELYKQESSYTGSTCGDYWTLCFESGKKLIWTRKEIAHMRSSVYMEKSKQLTCVQAST
jgi:hypothetical protein